MKGLYQRFFYVPENGRVREQVLMARVAVTMVLIILYLLSMSLSAYAFYVSGDGNHNLIQTACFSGELTIYGSDGQMVEREEGGICRILLEPDVYTVHLSYGGTAETGFFVLRLNGSQYHTRQFFRQERRADEQVLTLELYEETLLQVIPHWGTSACYDEFSRRGDRREDYLTEDETLQVGEPPGEPEEELMEREPPEETPVEKESTEPEEPAETDPLE